MKKTNALRLINFHLTQLLSLCYVHTEIDDMFRLIFCKPSSYVTQDLQ